jgi:hypothetical protein
MWTKYDYVCSDCDTLIEITTLDNLPECFEPQCPCGSNNIIYIGVSDGNAPIITDVTNVTPRTVVKIDSNPYN